MKINRHCLQIWFHFVYLSFYCVLLEIVISKWPLRFYNCYPIPQKDININTNIQQVWPDTSSIVNLSGIISAFASPAILVSAVDFIDNKWYVAIDR
jgi:phage-related protein